MRKADRLFQMVNLIRVHQPITAQALADRLDVSVRTVYRYIDDVSLSGIPVYGEPGLGYAMHKDFELPPLALSADELEALVLSVGLLTRAVGHELSAAARSLLSKIQAVAPDSAGARAQHAICSLAAPYSDHHKHCWDRLRTAIAQGHCVELAYLSLQDEASQREVFPLGLFYWGGKWTLGAWCALRQGYRDFRVDRITSVRASPRVMPVDAGISLAAYMAHHRHNELGTDKTLSGVAT